MEQAGRRWRVLSRTAAVCILLTILQSCAQRQNGPPVSWDSPKLREIEGEWNSLWDAARDGPKKERGQGDDPKTQVMVVLIRVDRLFEQRFSARDLHELATSAEVVQIRAEGENDSVVRDPRDFGKALLQFMIRTFVKKSDRENLLELLSRRCPSRVDWTENIEYYLAFRGKKLKAPMAILGEAYSKSQVPETRHALAAAVRRGFAGFGIRGKDDAEFVKNAMRFYEREKDNLIVNEEYPKNESVGLGFESYERHPEYYDNPPYPREMLFKKKPGR